MFLRKYNFYCENQTTTKKIKFFQLTSQHLRRGFLKDTASHMGTASLPQWASDPGEASSPKERARLWFGGLAPQHKLWL